MSAFFEMGGYGIFVWPAYGVTALVMVGLVVATARRSRALKQELEALERAAADQQDDAHET